MLFSRTKSIFGKFTVAVDLVTVVSNYDLGLLTQIKLPGHSCKSGVCQVMFIQDVLQTEWKTRSSFNYENFFAEFELEFTLGHLVYRGFLNQLESLGWLSFLFLDRYECHLSASGGSRLFGGGRLEVLVFQTLSDLVKWLFMYNDDNCVQSISLEVVDLVGDKRLMSDW